MRIGAGVRVAPYSVIGHGCQVGEGALIDGAILWPDCRIHSQAGIGAAILGRDCQIGANASISSGAVLGDRTIVTDYSRA